MKEQNTKINAKIFPIVILLTINNNVGNWRINI